MSFNRSGRSEISRCRDQDRSGHLPAGHESTKTAYPVVYLFYSDWVEGYYAQLSTSP